MLPSLIKYSAADSIPNKSRGIFAATAVTAVSAFVLPVSKYLPDIFLTACCAAASAVIIISTKAKKTNDIRGFSGLILINLLTGLCFAISATKLMIKSQEIGAFMAFFDIDAVKRHLFAALITAGTAVGFGAYIINRAATRIKFSAERILSGGGYLEPSEIKFLTSINEVSKIVLFLNITAIFIFMINIINSTAKGIIASAETNISAKTYLCCSAAIALIIEAQLIILSLCSLGVIGKIFGSSSFSGEQEPCEKGCGEIETAEGEKDIFEQILSQKKDLIFEEASWVCTDEKK